MDNLVIVDGNNWFRRRAESTLMGSPVRNCFHELHNKNAMVVCVWDGFKALEARRKLYPDYKVKRIAPPSEHYASQNLLKQLLEFSRVTQVQVDGFEGDDVIAALVERYRKDFKSIYLESNDLDLYQLACPMARDKFPERPKWVQLFKTMVGDPSDNIPGAKGFGKGSWEKLTEDNKAMIEHIILFGWGYTPEEVKEKVQDFFPPKALQWFCEKENRQQLLTFHKVVGFVAVDMALINKGMKHGMNRPDLAEPIFVEFML